MVQIQGGGLCFLKNDDADVDIRAFVTSSKIDEESDKTENVIKLGDFAVFTSFLKRIIGSAAGGR